MASNTFDFKQFSIQQDRCAMKVGTDGVLLGAWATATASTQQVLDIGTGTGVVALLLAQRLTEAGAHWHTHAVEIDPAAAQQAQENVAASPWSGHIEVFATSLSRFADEPASAHLYDLIVSNPPFYNATLKPKDSGRAIARHKDSLPIDEITRFARTHLSEGGRLALIYPTAYDGEVMQAAVLSGLKPVRICDILTRVGKVAKRRMAELALSTAQVSHETLAIRGEDGRYTPEYRLLTEDFYLRLTD